MVVRVIVPMSGPSRAWAAGDLYECDDAAAARLVAAGIAVPVAPAGIDPVPVAPEAAVAEPPERAVRPRARGRGRG